MGKKKNKNTFANVQLEKGEDASGAKANEEESTMVTMESQSTEMSQIDDTKQMGSG